jgi:hypothetical protein
MTSSRHLTGRPREEPLASRHHSIDIKASAQDNACMRTTLTLEKDVAARLQHVARKRRQSFKTVVNEALRAGSTDGDCSKFPDVTWLNPVTAKRI